MRYAPPLLRAFVVVLLLSLATPHWTAGSSTIHTERQEAPFAEDRTPALDLRVALGRLLGEHAYLLMEAMQTDVEAERTAFESALAENSDALTGAVRTLYGDEEGARFGALWEHHVALLLEYGDAVRARDAEAQRSARDELDTFVEQLGELLVDLNPGLDPAQEAHALQAHIDQIKAFAAGNYADAYTSRRTAFSHMFQLGDHLALEIVRQYPERFTADAVAFSPRSDLQLALDRLLSEHMVLSAEAMRAGVRGAPEFDAASTSLDENTDDLVDAIAAVYGADAGTEFGEVWREHTAAYLAYVDALGAGDETDREQSIGRLHSYHDRIAQFLTAANPMLDGTAVADLIRRHVQALITQAEATAADDPARAIAATREGYAGTFDVGAALADAIARQFPDRFQDLVDLPLTDAESVVDPGAMSTLLVAALALSAGLWVALTAHLGQRKSAGRLQRR